MGRYRIYHVEGGGRLRLGETFQASSDGEAAMKARILLVRGQPGELWEAGRIVGRFSATHVFSPGAG